MEVDTSFSSGNISGVVDSTEETAMPVYFRTENEEKIEKFEEAVKQYNEEAQKVYDWVEDRFGEGTKIAWGRNDTITAVTGSPDEFEYMTSGEMIDGQQTIKPDKRYSEGKEVAREMKQMSPTSLRQRYCDIAQVPPRIFDEKKMTMHIPGFHFDEESRCMYLSLSEGAYEELDLPDCWNAVHYDDVPESVRS